MYYSPSRKDPFDFGVRRSKAMVTGQDCFWMITPVRINDLFSDFPYLSLITYHSRKTPIDFGFKRTKVEVTGQDCLQISSVFVKKLFMYKLFSKNPLI